jgi:hypothetical protein
MNLGLTTLPWRQVIHNGLQKRAAMSDPLKIKSPLHYPIASILSSTDG